MTSKSSECNYNQVLVFLGALVAGTICSLTSKILLHVKGKGLSGEEEAFSSPLFQTFSMFFVLNFALVLHYLTLRFRIPIAGYSFKDNSDDKKSSAHMRIHYTTYLLLIFPTIFDIAATGLAMVGLMHVNASVYQILRGTYQFFPYYT